MSQDFHPPYTATGHGYFLRVGSRMSASDLSSSTNQHEVCMNLRQVLRWVALRSPDASCAIASRARSHQPQRCTSKTACPSGSFTMSPLLQGSPVTGTTCDEINVTSPP